MAAIAAANDEGRREEIHGSLPGFESDVPGNPPSGELRVQRFHPGDLLSNPLPLVSLEQHAPAEAGFDRRIEFDVTRGGKAGGVVLWLHREMSADARDDGPVGAATVETISDARRHVLYSWPAVVQLTAGDSIRLGLRAEPSDRGYDWHWDSLIRKIVSGRIQGIRYQRTTDSPLSMLNGERR
jgi:hypothetical protein